MTWPLVERRAFPRRNLRIKIQIELPKSFTENPVTQLRRYAFARNIGLGGMLIISSISIPPGIQVRVWIPFYKQGQTLELTGVVTRSVRTMLGHEVALQFVNMNSLAESLIAQYVGAEQDVV
ncbi:MAG: PilZ domain-containing protein [Planctomycetota bacterium]|nr:MAG: PilZ domain-containing protein [Planctomycetota bacterium]